MKIDVEDTGIGIKEENKEKIFQLFSQAYEKIRNNDTGIGFRLSLCKDLASLLKGTISIMRKEIGVIFSVAFPISSKDAENSAHLENIDLGSWNKSNLSRILTIRKNIMLNPKEFIKSDSRNSNEVDKLDMLVLIVDDNNSNIFVLKSMLKKLGVKHETAQNGQEAINIVLAKGIFENFSLILMDINMPVMNGIMATKVLTTHMKEQTIPTIPIVALSAQGDDTIINDAMQAGVKEYVEKPLSKAKLEHILKKYEWAK